MRVSPPDRLYRAAEAPPFFLFLFLKKRLMIVLRLPSCGSLGKLFITDAWKLPVSCTLVFIFAFKEGANGVLSLLVSQFSLDICLVSPWICREMPGHWEKLCYSIISKETDGRYQDRNFSIAEYFEKMYSSDWGSNGSLRISWQVQLYVNLFQDITNMLLHWELNFSR